jgi:hypothetical protein
METPLELKESDPTQPGSSGCLTVLLPGMSEPVTFLLMSAESYQELKRYEVSPTPSGPDSSSSDFVRF